MLLEILNIVAPVFLVIAAGYLAVRSGIGSAEAIDQLMRFAVQFAIPCLLFRATSTIDLGVAFSWGMLLAYYIGAIGCFVAAYFIVRKLFNRRPGEAVGIAFAAMFSNLVMLGLPISERAWGVDTLAPNYALVAVNAPICYLLGITAMEYLRADGRGVADTTQIVIKAMFRNSLMIGIGLGLGVGIVVILIKSYQNSHFLHIEDKSDGRHRITMTLAEEVTFFHKGAILKELDSLPRDTYLEINLLKTRYLDNDIIEILDDFSYKANLRNITIKLVSERGTVENPPSYLEFFRLTPKKELYRSLSDVSK